MTINNQTPNGIRFVSFDKFNPASKQSITLQAGESFKLRKGYRLDPATIEKLTPTGLPVIGKQASVNVATQPYQTYIF